LKRGLVIVGKEKIRAAWRRFVHRLVVLTPRIAYQALPVVALGLIGVGAWCVYRPAAFLTVGGLMWFDLTFGGRNK